MSIANRVKDYLDRRHIPWDPMSHARSGTCMEAARLAHVPPDRLAKAVVLRGNTRYLMAVIPANHQLNLAELREALGDDLSFAGERTLEELFADCAAGAVPPLGPAYGIPTLWDDALAAKSDVYFEGGDHTTLVHMQGKDFAAVMKEASRLPPACH